MGEDVKAEDPAHAVLTPLLVELASLVKQGAARVLAGASDSDVGSGDRDAVHDLRVALRRLRTLLRPARRIYEAKRARAISDDLRRFARATSALRDEEVLGETLDELDLPADIKQDLAPFRARRARREQARRAEVLRLLDSPALDAALGQVTALLRPRRPHRSASKLARRAVREAARGVRRQASADPDDVGAMHALRIRYKRLRYVAELFAPVLGPSAEEIVKVATRMQRRLGHLHDLDEAIARVERARGLPRHARAAVREALAAARATTGEHARRDIAEATAALEPW